MNAAQVNLIVQEAHKAGMAAGAAITPTPMHVQCGTTVYKVDDGLCGFAWITIKPGTSSFARALVKQGIARAAYGGGVQVWVGEFNQSVARKSAYAEAYANVLRAYTIKAYAGSRLD